MAGMGYMSQLTKMKRPTTCLPRSWPTDLAHSNEGKLQRACCARTGRRIDQFSNLTRSAPRITGRPLIPDSNIELLLQRLAGKMPFWMSTTSGVKVKPRNQSPANSTMLPRTVNTTVPCQQARRDSHRARLLNPAVNLTTVACQQTRRETATERDLHDKNYSLTDELSYPAANRVVCDRVFTLTQVASDQRDLVVNNI